MLFDLQIYYPSKVVLLDKNWFRSLKLLNVQNWQVDPNTSLMH